MIKLPQVALQLRVLVRLEVEAAPEVVAAGPVVEVEVEQVVVSHALAKMSSSSTEQCVLSRCQVAGEVEDVEAEGRRPVVTTVTVQRCDYMLCGSCALLTNNLCCTRIRTPRLYSYGRTIFTPGITLYF